MRKIYKPRAFAAVASRFFAENPRCALWAKPGMGKTVLTLTHLDILHNVLGEGGRTLVIAPRRVALDVWPDEARKWLHLRDLSVVAAIGTPEERRAALARNAQVVAINYENVQWLIRLYGANWPFTTVVADECSKLKGHRGRNGSVRAQALAHVAHKRVKRWINLTGTPASNGLQDLWGQTWFLDEGQRLGRTFTAFHDRWFRPVHMEEDKRVVWVPTTFAAEDINDRLKDICLTLDPRDWFDLKEPIVSTIEVKMSSRVMAGYKELQKELFLRLESGREVEVFSKGGLLNKLLQYANGAVYTDKLLNYEVVHDEKLDALESLMAETGNDPLLVCYQFRSDIERLRKRWPDALVISEKEDRERAKNGEGKLWLAHPASVGHGVDGLQKHCNTVVFFAQDWNLENHDQIIERVGPMRQFQEGRDVPVFIYYIVAAKTTDEVVMKRRSTKRSVQDSLMDYMKEMK